jgi:hypothetical protein
LVLLILARFDLRSLSDVAFDYDSICALTVFFSVLTSAYSFNAGLSTCAAFLSVLTSAYYFNAGLSTCATLLSVLTSAYYFNDGFL